MTQANIVPIKAERQDISFAEIPIRETETVSALPLSTDQSIHPLAVIKANQCSIALSGDIPESLLTRILQEVVRA